MRKASNNMDESTRSRITGEAMMRRQQGELPP
eukprot:CAMPEP_0176324802 /NCGR_PEP_ID=MMETSP0121_2-20121125/73078_1 /TAXON_ID=160619 /ORGANISM="Kryptoperidinium foliaceum, Strain CCMP 1326" /LENGTH=31 /DNA_ID= /DNA_START= /DNA_END= /DNA_ORIENTATION=